MAHKIGIYYDEQGLKEIMSSQQMEEMERAIMLQKKSEVEAAFLQSFGVPGSFAVNIIRSQNKIWKGKFHAGRVIFRIIPEDSRTNAILGKHPGWLANFL